MNAHIYIHPRVFARRAAEIAEAQDGRIRWDARGRPFVLTADPVASAAAPAEDLEPRRFERLRRAFQALAARRRVQKPR